MKENARNVTVGMTVIGGILILGALIMVFASLPERFRGGYDLHVLLDSSGGIEPGDEVNFQGIVIGRVTGVDFTDPDSLASGVTITLRIDEKYTLPARIEVVIQRNMFGGSYINMYPGGPERFDSEGRKLETIPKDRTISIRGITQNMDPVAQIRPVLNMVEGMANDLRPAVRSFARLANNLNRMLGDTSAGRSDQDTGKGDANTPADANQPCSGSQTRPSMNLAGTVQRLNRTLDALYEILGDPNSQQDLKTTFSNLADASSKMSDAMDALKATVSDANATLVEARGAFSDISDTAVAAKKNLAEVSEKVIEDAEKLSELMTTVNEVASKVNDGKGSAGKLVNDPKLYNSLVESAEQMDKLLKEIRALVKAWEKTGVPIKLK